MLAKSPYNMAQQSHAVTKFPLQNSVRVGLENPGRKEERQEQGVTKPKRTRVKKRTGKTKER